MSKDNAAVKSLYHQIEDYFFTSVSQEYRHFADNSSAYLTGVEAASLNPFIIKQPDAFIGADLEDGVRLFEVAGLPYVVVVPDNVIDQLRHHLRAIDLTAAYTTVAMQLATDHFTPHYHKSSDYEIIPTDENLSDWALPLESAFESNQNLMLQYRTRHQAALDRGRQLSHFSLYVKGRPVCSLTLSIDGRVARLDDIGTQTGFQGKGYASALIQHALMHAKSHNVAWCFLEASNQGISIYRKTGFLPLFDYVTFLRE